MAKNIIENEEEWGLLDAYNKDNNFNWSSEKRKKTWMEGGDNDAGEDDWWELHKISEIVEEINKNKKEQRERAELARVERSKSRWAIKAKELEKKEIENEKEKEKENEKEKEDNDRETSAERRFRIGQERALHQQEWRDQRKYAISILKRKAEPAFRFDATDSPLSWFREEGELDYLPQPVEEEDEEEEKKDENNNNNY
jgi:hypothetical protein